MKHYSRQTKVLVAIDCIIFGFDGEELKILLIKRGFEPKKGHWSLAGEFVKPRENFEDAASRILKELTGLGGVYMEQLHAFGEPDRDPVTRTLSIAYFALIDIHKYEKQLSVDYHAEWFPLKKIPKLVFDHGTMVEMAKGKLRRKASTYPVLFELLPEKFTIPQLHSLYESVYDVKMDKRNFSRKLMSERYLIKQKEKEKDRSKKGAYYFKLDKKKTTTNFNFIRFPGKLR
jgi:ADP-ribose pyrophosphatase YjhB (NUDIX family)